MITTLYCLSRTRAASQFVSVNDHMMGRLLSKHRFATKQPTSSLPKAKHNQPTDYATGPFPGRGANGLSPPFHSIP